MKKIVEFYKKYWLIIVLAFIATSLLLIKIFLVPNNTETQASPTPQANNFNGILPGKTKIQDANLILGTPDPKQSDISQNMIAYPRQEGSRPNEVYTDDNQVITLIKQKVATGNLSDFKQRYGNPESEFFGPAANSGFKLYLYLSKGLGVVASQEDGTALEVWYFQPMKESEFLQQPWAKSLSKEEDTKTSL